MYNTKLYNSFPYATSMLHGEGGSLAVVAIAPIGTAKKYTLYGAKTTVSIIAKSRGGRFAAGYSKTGITVTAKGAGYAIFVGGNKAEVRVSTAGIGTKTALGMGLTVVSVTPFGQHAIPVIEYVPLGTFWSGDWSVPDDGMYAQTTGRDRLELLRHSTYEPVSDYYDINNLYDLAVDIFQSAGLAETEYWVDPELEQFGTGYAYIGSPSHREALRLIAEACVGQVYCDREGVVRVEGPSFVKTGASEEAYIITPDDYFTKDNPIKWGGIANYVEVETQPLRSSGNEEEVYRSSEAVQIEANQEIAISALYRVAPCIGAAASLENAEPEIEIVKEDYFADGAEIIVHSTVEGAFELVINATPLKIIGSDLIVLQDHASIADQGLIKFTFPKNPLVQRVATAEMIAGYILFLYKNPRQNIEMDWRGNPALELGDVVQAPVFQHDNLDEQECFVTTKQEIEYDGGLRAKLSGYKITDQEEGE